MTASPQPQVIKNLDEVSLKADKKSEEVSDTQKQCPTQDNLEMNSQKSEYQKILQSLMNT